MKSSMDAFDKKRDSMRGWANNPNTKAFMEEYLAIEREVLINRFKGTMDPHIVFRIQGELARIDKILMAVEALKVAPERLQVQTPTGGK